MNNSQAPKNAYEVQVFNNISRRGLDRFPSETFQVGSDLSDPDVILCRSENLRDFKFGAKLKTVGRAGVGVNNIPVDILNDRGIPVFRTPGANANAVKELVLAGLLISCRHLCDAWSYTRALSQTGSALTKAVEAGKKQFAGQELPGKVLGIIGLGAIGRSVADICLDLGMRVVGYDPELTVDGAWRLSSSVERAKSIQDVFKAADFVSLHVPLNDATRGMIGSEIFDGARSGLCLLNFARDQIVDAGALKAAIDNGRVAKYVTDFPDEQLLHHERVIAFPHLGASTLEAEENCAVMVVDQVRDFLENGNIYNAVNFPNAVMERGSDYRICVSNRNVPNMLGQISTTMAQANLNICDMLNQSRGELAYTIVDVDIPIPDNILQQISAIEGVLNARIV